jgi:hypothetical protein
MILLTKHSIQECFGERSLSEIPEKKERKNQNSSGELFKGKPTLTDIYFIQILLLTDQIKLPAILAPPTILIRILLPQAYHYG